MPELGDGEEREKVIDKLARTAAMITNVDANVGRLIALLDHLGLAENTLVIVLVDNGPDGRRYVGPFRGKKSEVYEGGVRSPLWLHWTAGLVAGANSDEPAAHIDLMPTILDACDVTVPDGLELDGRSFLPLLVGETANWPDRTLALQSHRGREPQRYHNFMIRDARWKLVHPSGFSRQRFEGEPRFELYDLIDDPGEKSISPNTIPTSSLG